MAILYGLLVIIFFGGCEKQIALKPFISTCCMQNSTQLINKTIYIGHFALTNKNNQMGVFGNKSFVTGKEIENIEFEENIDVIIREELLKRLSQIYKTVVFVDTKPSVLDSDNIYIYGELKNLWILQKYVNIYSKKFNFTNVYNFNIESMVNDESIKDNFNANLEISSNIVNQKSNISGVVMAALFNFHALDEAINGDVGQAITHKLYINNKLISDIFYYQFLESGVGRFTTDYKVVLQANIFGKYPQKIEDSSSGNVNKFEIWNMAYSYLSPNLNASPGYNYVGGGTFNLYKSKEQLEQLKQENVIAQKKYEKCILTNSVFSQECNKPNKENSENKKYYDIFRQYTTTSGILQYLIHEHIDNVVQELAKKN